MKELFKVKEEETREDIEKVLVDNGELLINVLTMGRVIKEYNQDEISNELREYRGDYYFIFAKYVNPDIKEKSVDCLLKLRNLEGFDLENDKKEVDDTVIPKEQIELEIRLENDPMLGTIINNVKKYNERGMVSSIDGPASVRIISYEGFGEGIPRYEATYIVNFAIYTHKQFYRLKYSPGYAARQIDDMVNKLAELKQKEIRSF